MRTTVQRVTELEAQVSDNKERFQKFITKIVVIFKEERVRNVNGSLDTQEWKDLSDHDDAFIEEFGYVFENPEMKYEDVELTHDTADGHVNIDNTSRIARRH